MESSETGLVISGLRKTYAKTRIALAGVDLRVGTGLYGLLGPNGAGKSTLMRTLAALQEPDAGSIVLDGVDVRRDPDHLRRRLGYLPQHIGSYAGVSARSLLERFAWMKGRTDKRQRLLEVASLLERVNLSDAADQSVSTFSGGMLRRFGIALALIGTPRLLIVDEPTAGLDPAERNRFHRVLADVAEGSIVLLSTHIVEDIENLCGQLAILSAGRIVAEGTPATLTAPLRGKLWTRIVPRGQPVPDALRLVAAPQGTRVITLSASAPGPEYAAHEPTLEDVYYAALDARLREAA